MTRPDCPRLLDFETPGRARLLGRLDHGTMWGVHLIPVTVFVGTEAKPGRGVVAFGSTHGNEYEGPTAIKALSHELTPDRVSGRLIPRASCAEPRGLPHGDARQRRGGRSEPEPRLRPGGGARAGAVRCHAPDCRACRGGRSGPTPTSFSTCTQGGTRSGSTFARASTRSTTPSKPSKRPRPLGGSACRSSWFTRTGHRVCSRARPNGSARSRSVPSSAGAKR